MVIAEKQKKFTLNMGPSGVQLFLYSASMRSDRAVHARDISKSDILEQVSFEEFYTGSSVLFWCTGWVKRHKNSW
jgi:hypothetical protein